MINTSVLTSLRYPMKVQKRYALTIRNLIALSLTGLQIGSFAMLGLADVSSFTEEAFGAAATTAPTKVANVKPYCAQSLMRTQDSNLVYTDVYIVTCDNTGTFSQRGHEVISGAYVLVAKYYGEEICIPELPDIGCFIQPTTKLYWWETDTPIPFDALKIAPDLSTATLKANLTGIESVSGLQKNTTINVTWDATARAERDSATFRNISEGCINTSLASSTVRAGSIDGSVSNEDLAIDLTQLSPVEGFFSSTQISKDHGRLLDSSKCIDISFPFLSQEGNCIRAELIDNNDEGGSVYTYVSIFGCSDVSSSTPSTFADVQVYKFLGREVCDPELGCFIEPLQDLYLVEGYGSIPPDSLKIASDLSSATLNASFIGIEDISGLQKEITIDATFTSTTEPQHIFETTRFTRGSCINTYHTNAAQVDAAISGTVSTNDFTVDVGQLAPNPNFSSAIELMKINQVTLESSKCSS